MKKFTPLTLAVCLLLSTAATPPSANEYYQSGLQKMKQQKFLEAISDFTEAVSLDVNYADAYFQRANAKELLARQKGYTDTEHYADLLKAMRLGKSEATQAISEGYAGECISGLKHTLKADEVYCLDISGAAANAIPVQLSQMPHLVQLSVGDNQLTDLEAIFAHNQTLLFLDARGNNIKHLSGAIKNLAFLQELNLRDNALTSLPVEMQQMKHLRVLNLAGNPMTNEEIAKIRRILPHCKVYVGEKEPMAKLQRNPKFRGTRKTTASQANSKAPRRF